MSRKRKTKDEEETALAPQARGGVVFACEWVEIELRAARSRVGPTIKAYSNLLGSESGERAIKEILVDLRHYCEGKGLVFDQLNRAAAFQYKAELADLDLT